MEGILLGVISARFFKLLLFRRRGDALRHGTAAVPHAHVQDDPSSHVGALVAAYILKRAALILGCSILIWAAGKYPKSPAVQREYAARLARLEAAHAGKAGAPVYEGLKERLSFEKAAREKEHTVIGRAGSAIHPLPREPLGLNWQMSSLKRAGILSVLAILLLATELVPRAASASGPVAISGSFYAQKFEIPVGGVVRSSSVYVVAFNQGTEAVTFVVGYTAPPDVTLDLSETEFVLDPGQSKEVLVAVRVGADAVPGSYEIAVNVKALGGGSGIELLGAAEQVASLTIVDEAGDVHVETVSPGGERLLSHVRLWKIIEGNEYEYAESVTGVLDAVVSPGSYVVKAFSMGVELASRGVRRCASETEEPHSDRGAHILQEL